MSVVIVWRSDVRRTEFVKGSAKQNRNKTERLLSVCNLYFKVE